MAAKIIWTDRSQQDLFHIYQYIAQDSVTYASQFVNELIKTVSNQLKTFPSSGRKIPELENPPLSYLREVIRF